jgi:tetratricopeptide (TPR) repeat protein
MFHYPQRRDLGLFTPADYGALWYMKLSNMLFDLGHVNYAEKWAHEALAIEGNRPWILKRLALINVLKGRIEAARTFAGLLQRSPLHKAWADRLMHALDVNPAMPGNRELARIRTCLFTADHPGNYAETEEMLGQLLEEDPKNRMAYDYLMAHYMLTGQLDRLVRNLGRLQGFGVPTIPQYYQQALAMYNTALREKGLPGVYEPLVSRAVHERLSRFRKALRRHNRDLEAGRAGLAAEFGDTYWYYYIFNESGASWRVSGRGANQ